MKRGFTLIELLAVIVILAIIAVIAVPIVLNIIDDTKKNAFEQSINGIVKSANIKSTMELKTEEILYKYENENWVENKLDIDGETPKYVEIKVNKKGQTRYAITDGKYCVMKEYDSASVIKKIGSEIKEKYCKLDIPEPTEESCFEYSVSKEQVTIKNYKCGSTIKDVVIPDEIDGYPVTAISSWSFDQLGLTSVIIPDSVKTIGASSFRSNKLTNITIGAGVKTIGAGSFYNNLLTEIIIPDNVTSIEAGAFRGNQLPDEEAFIYNLKKDGSIDYSSLNSYAGSKRKNVIIPNQKNGVELTKIGESSFDGINLKNVTIPNSIKIIGKEAFSSNSLSNIIIPDGVESIGIYTFSHNYTISKIIVPDSVTEIGYGAFMYNSITEFVLSKNITKIPSQLFAYNKVKKVEIPNNIISIGSDAFRDNLIEELSIASSVTEIGYAAFLKNELKDEDAFIYNRNKDGSIDYSSLNSYGGAKRENVIIPSEVNGVKLTNIGLYAFAEIGLKSVVLPDSLISIDGAAFEDDLLTNITIPDSVTTIGEKVFYNNSLNSIIIPNSVNSIGSEAFRYNNLKSVTLPSSLTTIERYAFSNNKLTSVIVEGKSSKDDFTSYPTSSPFGWASGYSDSDITWKGTN